MLYFGGFHSMKSAKFLFFSIFVARYNTKNMESVIGRKEEIKEINELYNSGQAELQNL